jgi:hypothetical protein
LIEPGSPDDHGQGGAWESFALSHYDQAIEGVVLPDNQSVPAFLGKIPPAREIARLAGEGIRQEGLRCLEGASDADTGTKLCHDLIECDTIEAVLRTCAHFYTRDTFFVSACESVFAVGYERECRNRP